MSDVQGSQSQDLDRTQQTRERHRIPGRLAVLLAILSACALVCGGLWYWLEMPRYIELAIPSPGSRWDYIERTTQVWLDDGSRYFIVRKETTAYPRDGYDTWMSIATYLEEWLTEHGWLELGDSPGYCNIVLPETNFLDYGENGYRAYRRVHAPVFDPAPTTCVAIWPIWPQSNDGFHIVVVTENPSGLTELLYSLDHPGPVWRVGEGQ